MLWNKKVKMSVFNRAISNGGDNYKSNTRLEGSQEVPRMKREIKLLSSRIERMFSPTNK